MNAPSADPVETIRMDEGREFVLRALRPDDVDALRRAYRRLTPEEIEYRFFYRSRELPEFISEQVRNLDPVRDAAFVVDDGGEIRAAADLHSANAHARSAEFGLIVGKAISGRGIGRRLMRRLLTEAKRRGIEELRGSVLTVNARMLALCHDLGAHIDADPQDRSIRRVTFRP